jgi:chemotaxis protein MotB
VGLASSIPYVTENPNDPMNRRISIIVMNKKTENQVIHEGMNVDPAQEKVTLPESVNPANLTPIPPPLH